MTKLQLIALIAGALHGGRTGNEGFGEEGSIEVDVKIAEKIWLKAVEEDA